MGASRDEGPQPGTDLGSRDGGHGRSWTAPHSTAEPHLVHTTPQLCTWTWSPQGRPTCLLGLKWTGSASGPTAFLLAGEWGPRGEGAGCLAPKGRGTLTLHWSPQAGLSFTGPHGPGAQSSSAGASGLCKVPTKPETGFQAGSTSLSPTGQVSVSGGGFPKPRILWTFQSKGTRSESGATVSKGRGPSHPGRSQVHANRQGQHHQPSGRAAVR